MEYIFLQEHERTELVDFYAGYFYNKGEKELLIAFLDRFPTHINWLYGEVMFFLKNSEKTCRYSDGTGANLDIRDDQIFQYFMTGTDESNTYYDEPNLENYPDRVIEIAEFMQIHPVIIEIIISHKLKSIGSKIFEDRTHEGKTAN